MIKKSDVIRTLDEQDAEAYRLLCKTVDARLPSYDGKRSIIVSVPKGTSDKVVDKIISAYSGPGGEWTVTRNKGDDQRDGGWDNLVFS